MMPAPPNDLPGTGPDATDDPEATEPPLGPDEPLPPPNLAVVRFVTACAALILLIIYWWVAMNALPPGPINLPQVSQFAFRSAAQTIGLILAAIAGFSLIGQASRGRRAGDIMPWALAFMAGALLLEQHWGVALGFAVTAIGLTVHSFTKGKR